MKLTQKKLERVQLTDTQIKLEMPVKILNQIKWLCKEIPKVEWSGILFYSVEGSIKDPENMVLTIQDILPMQKGTAAYTEYAFDERVVDYRMENEEADEWKVGHIHSHNTMAVYFSGTDWSELEDNSPNHNFYLSLIVNNFMDFCAKVSFIVEADETREFNFTARDENGEKYEYSSEQYEVKQKKLVSYDCKIHSPEASISVEESFSEKVKGIIATATEKDRTRVHTSTKIYTPGEYKKHGGKRFPTNARVKEDWSSSGWGQNWYGQNTESVEAEINAEEEAYEDLIEDFIMFVLNTGNDISSFSHIDEVITKYQTYNLSPNALKGKVIQEYVSAYNVYFAHHTKIETAEMFIGITEKVIEDLEIEVYIANKKYHRDMYSAVAEGLKLLITKFKENEFNTVK